LKKLEKAGEEGSQRGVKIVTLNSFQGLIEMLK
jgi:hypothetical protein